MLLYNHKKEFLGIDALDLHLLGLKNLSALQNESFDFADLFVKTPGYIHNFKHVHWIDFITCADSDEIAKAIIHIQGENFQCHLRVTTFYLSDSPHENAFCVTLLNLQKLTDVQSKDITSDIALQKTTQLFKEEEFITPVVPTTKSLEIQNPIKAPSVVPLKKEEEIIGAHEESTLTQIEEDTYDEMPLDTNFDTSKEATISLETSEIRALETSSTLKDTRENIQEYVFNPEVASKELGLPIDLIEEFIQDFIAQSVEFKNELYKTLQEKDLTNLKIISHKLKGVAANLRIANALDALTIVNTVDDFSIIKTNLDKFFKIITKLSSQKIQHETALSNQAQKEEAKISELLFIDEQEEEEEVPRMSHMPELADDYFEPMALHDETEYLNIDFETVDANALSLEVSEIKELPDALEENFNEKEIQKLPALLLEYNKEAVAKEIGIDIDSFYELFNEFISESKKITIEMHEALNNKNIQLFRAQATQLQGMSENMRVKELEPCLHIIITTSQSKVALKALHDINAILSHIEA